MKISYKFVHAMHQVQVISKETTLFFNRNLSKHDHTPGADYSLGNTIYDERKRARGRGRSSEKDTLPFSARQ